MPVEMESEAQEDESEIVGMMDERELVLSEEESVQEEEQTDLIVIEITVIVVIIMICGMFYAGWRYLIDRRQKQKDLGYYNGNLSNDLLVKSP